MRSQYWQGIKGNVPFKHWEGWEVWSGEQSGDRDVFWGAICKCIRGFENVHTL